MIHNSFIHAYIEASQNHNWRVSVQSILNMPIEHLQLIITQYLRSEMNNESQLAGPWLKCDEASTWRHLSSTNTSFPSIAAPNENVLYFQTFHLLLGSRWRMQGLSDLLQRRVIAPSAHGKGGEEHQDESNELRPERLWPVRETEGHFVF